MQYSITENKGVIAIQLTGELTLSDEESFRELSLKVQSYASTKCSLDISRVEFLDSAGLGLLLVLNELCEEGGKTLSLKVADGPVREILDISEFNQLIPFEDE
jgi:anti-anti-sigma factor